MQVAISNEGPCYSMITEKQQQNNITCVWFLVYFVSTSYRYIRCDETVLLPITLDCRQGVWENFMKGQGVRVRIKVKNHCIRRICIHPWLYYYSFKHCEVTRMYSETTGVIHALRIYEQLVHPLKNRVWPEFTVFNIYLLSFRILNNLRLPWKTEFALKFFTVLK